jgi:hypothetical protein
VQERDRISRRELLLSSYQYWLMRSKMPLSYMSRRNAIATLVFLPLLPLIGLLPTDASAAAPDDELLTKFKFLSENGNSNCSGRFMKSIAAMPAAARLQGSCCAPMDAHHYVEQVRALKKYVSISNIPPDPYDVRAELAQKLMAYYDKPLSNTEQTAYDFAMNNSEEKGPCCCKCWRWYVYGGLGKYLVQEKKFDGAQLVEVWNLSSDCGGGAEHHH